MDDIKNETKGQLRHLFLALAKVGSALTIGAKHSGLIDKRMIVFIFACHLD